MKYRIACAKPGRPEETASYLYDNQTNEIFDSEGCLVDFKKDERFADFLTKKSSDRVVKDFSPDEPIIGKSRRLTTLKIQLGMACNYHCQYCLQNAYRDGGARVANEQTVDAFFKILDEQGIKLAVDGQVELWGGEPLVYWKTLKVLLPKIRSRWGDEVLVKMVTNGSLLTKEKVDFLMAHRVTVIVSHDGPGFDLRDDVDPLTVPEIKEAWLYLLEQSQATGVPMGFCVVISPPECGSVRLKTFFCHSIFARGAFLFRRCCHK